MGSPIIFISDGGRQQLADRLLADVDFNETVFAASLSSNLIERLEETLGCLEYLGETNDPSKIDRNLQYTQLWRDLGISLSKKGVRDPDLEEAFLKWQSEGRAKYTLRKIESWRRKAESIGHCKTPSRVLEN